MKKPEDFIETYQYLLPENRIAPFPLKERSDSKLLQYKNGEISDYYFHQLPDLLPEKSLLVFNNTRVIHARIKFKLNSGAELEIFCLEPAYQIPVIEALGQTQSSVWNCLIGNNRKWKSGELEQIVSINHEKTTLKMERLIRNEDSFEVKFSWDSGYCFAEILEEIGKLPIPPYLKREAVEEDEKQYQTVYAKEEGSVAAPTAGLHFTPAIFKRLEAKMIDSVFLTLHVGAGTFKPVSTEKIADHVMHREKLIIELSMVESLLAQRKNGPVIAVGTTTLRTLESLYWLGVQLLNGKRFDHYFTIDQWEPYRDYQQLPEGQEVLEAIVDYAKRNNLQKLEGFTGIMITKDYKIRFADALITNFHQPGSTLLCLVSSILKDEWKRVYEHALSHDYRFLSFGDGNLYWV